MTLEQTQSSKWQFADHPWISYFVLSFSLIILIIIFAYLANILGIPADGVLRTLATPTIPHLITLFVLAPFVLKIPAGKKTFHQYLQDIRLSKFRPFMPLLLLGVTTSLITILSLVGTSIIFRVYQGIPLTGKFFTSLITNFRYDLPPISLGWIVAFPAIFEEISCRGIFLTQFGQKYSQRTAIIISALTFGFLHLVNLLFGGDPNFVLRQVIWGCLVGIFYAVMVLRVDSLLPAMIYHYLVNLLMGSASMYFRTYGSTMEVTILWTVNLCFLVPVLIFFMRWYASRFIPHN